MSVVLRASGPEFDVDAFVAVCGWTMATVFRRGEPRSPGRTSSEASGVNVVVSEAGLHDLTGQVADAIRFLAEHRDQVRRLVGWPGVEGVTLDFAIAWRDVAAQSDHLPAELVRLAGEAEIALEVSHYRGKAAPPMTDPITIQLTKHEAISLMDFLIRFRDKDELSLKCEADQQILYDLCALVQNELAPELTSEHWDQLLAAAQAAVVAGDE